MTTARVRLSRSTAAGLVCFSVIGLGGIAAAVLPNSGSGTTGVGGGASYQNVDWNFGSRFVSTASRTGAGMPTTKCQDASYDWRTSDGTHHDARRSRVCQADTARVGNWTEVAGFSGRPVIGARIAGGCNWEQSTNSYGICQALAGSVGDFGPGSPWNAPSHSVYLRRQDGTVDYNPGGSPNLAGS